MDWKSASSLICLYTVFTNTAVDTGFLPGPRWQNTSPLDCLYSTIHHITLQVLAFYTTKSNVLLPTEPTATQGPLKDRAQTLRISGLSNENKIRLLNISAALAALILYTSVKSDIWAKVLTTNALICWISARVTLTVKDREVDSRIGSVTTSVSFPKSRKDDISIGLAFVCVANSLSWWLIPGTIMDAQSWVYFLLSTLLLCTFATLMPGSALAPLGVSSRLFLGVLESSLVCLIWLFGYSEASTSVRAKGVSHHSGLSSLQALTLIWMDFAIMVCLGRKVLDQRGASWPSLVPAVVFTCLTSAYYFWLPHEAWAEAFQS